MTKERVEQAVHAAITRALAEAGVKQEVLVGMCIEVGLEAFRDAMPHDEPRADELTVWECDRCKEFNELCAKSCLTCGAERTGG